MPESQVQRIAARTRYIPPTPHDTGLGCPECRKPSIVRVGGEWCRWCRGFVSEVRLFHVETGASTVRVLRKPIS